MDNGTHMEWSIFVDLQLGSPPLPIDGEKHNNGPNLLCDDEEFERTNIFTVEGKEGWWSLLEVTRGRRSVQHFVDEEPLPLEKEEWKYNIDNLYVDVGMRIMEEQVGFINSPSSAIQSKTSKLLDPKKSWMKIFRESPSLLDIDSFRASDSSIDKDSPIYGERYVWDLISPNVKETMYPHQRGGLEFMWKSTSGDITLERLRDPLSTSEGGCIISHLPGSGKNPTHRSISLVIFEDVFEVSACNQFSIQFSS
ncbi:hypothetical protein H5410_004911 [Solanum commersonii]|uniref:Uncharacterized protein n=1 Tax=Solanum commersonii TaxID=4109 RepID=A0A9J6A557_SOLCO|nr:hypothetical protein H5410_004911 [Solanum commersonii]